MGLMFILDPNAPTSLRLGRFVKIRWSSTILLAQADVIAMLIVVLVVGPIPKYGEERRILIVVICCCWCRCRPEPCCGSRSACS